MATLSDKASVSVARALAANGPMLKAHTTVRSPHAIPHPSASWAIQRLAERDLRIHALCDKSLNAILAFTDYPSM